MSKEHRLSARQERIVQFIAESRRANGRPPTVREIGQAVGITSTSVVDYNLDKLERVGVIRRHREISRGIELVGSEDSGSRPYAVPIVGRIAAGRPIDAVQTDAEQIEIPSSMARDGLFALRVAGTSMIDDLIDDGDIVIVEPRETAQNGDIVVALVTDGAEPEGAATLKRFYRERDRIRLEPRNPNLRPIYVQPDHLRIQGRVVGLIRPMVL